jgi:hypothetical protein
MTATSCHLPEPTLSRCIFQDALRPFVHALNLDALPTRLFRNEKRPGWRPTAIADAAGLLDTLTTCSGGGTMMLRVLDDVV